MGVAFAIRVASSAASASSWWWQSGNNAVEDSLEDGGQSYLGGAGTGDRGSDREDPDACLQTRFARRRRRGLGGAQRG